MTWITVFVADNERYPLALRFEYDPATISALRADFGGEAAMLRWNPDAKCWMLKRSQFDALIAGYGDRLSVDYDALRVAYPPKTHKPKPAKQIPLWRGSR